MPRDFVTLNKRFTSDQQVFLHCVVAFSAVFSGVGEVIETIYGGIVMKGKIAILGSLFRFIFRGPRR